MDDKPIFEPLVSEPVGRRPNRDDRKPNWEVWKHIPHVTLEEAVALSLDIDPKKLRVHRQSWMAGHRIYQEAEAFDDRLAVASAQSRPDGALFTAWHTPTNRFWLSRFVVWAQSIGWGMPTQMLALAQGREPAPEKPILESERKNLLKIILGMAVGGYRYDPAVRNDAVQEIQKDVAAIGLQVSDDTIRRRLRDAETLFPDRKRRR